MKRFMLLCTALLVAHASQVFPVSGDEAVQRFQARMWQVSRLTGTISWTAFGGQTYYGTFKYLAPDRIYVRFSSPVEKILVSDGKTLWIYNPGTKMCGIQELVRGSSSGGIAALVSGYNSIATEGESGYTIKLKSSGKRYTEIILSVDPSYLLKGVIFKREDGKIISFSISDVSTQSEVKEKLFDFRVPKGVRVVRNPLNMR